MAIHLDRLTEDRLIRLIDALTAGGVDPKAAGAFSDRHTRERAISDGLDRVNDALTAAFTPNAAEVREALAALINFVPEQVPAQFTDPDANPHYGPADFKRKDVREELKQDSQQSWISEAYLYNLLGKEDARSVLARVRRLLQVLGYGDLYAFYPPE